MRLLKKFSVLAIAVFAISVVGVASASASQFTASANGELSGKALTNQVFVTNGGTVTCTGAATTGTVVAPSAAKQEVTVKYSGCTAFGFASVEISPATYEFTATGGGVAILNTITIKIPLAGCSVSVGPQSVGSTSFSNPTTSTIKEVSSVSKIKYTSTGGLCGTSGENGTYTGNSELSRVGGGTVQYDL
jgi:hypothetical protein